MIRVYLNEFVANRDFGDDSEPDDGHSIPAKDFEKVGDIKILDKDAKEDVNKACS